jgi:hypothetical protein
MGLLDLLAAGLLAMLTLFIGIRGLHPPLNLLKVLFFDTTDVYFWVAHTTFLPTLTVWGLLLVMGVLKLLPWLLGELKHFFQKRHSG